MEDLTELIAEAFGGRLVIDRELGGGGMSRVFLATEARIGRSVVIKVLVPELSADVSAERFRREIEIAARLQHPHVVPLLEVGAGDRIVCYSMPYVQGESLRARLNRERALAVTTAIRLWREILDALSYAHALGVVHRDIKPENVLLSGKHAMVTDFGVAKALGQATLGDRITGTGITLGTPAYMSPEQAAGDQQLDHRSDLYSAAVVMWEMLAGHHPFVGLTPQQMVSAHAVRVVPSLTDVRPAIPVALAALVQQCLAKNPADRPSNADEILAALESMPITDPSRTAQAPALPKPAPVEPTRGGRRTRTLAALGILGVVTAYVGFKTATHASTPAPTAEPATLRPEVAVADSIARRADQFFRMAAVLSLPGAPADAPLRQQAREIVMSALRADSMLFVPSSAQLTGLMRNARIPDRFIENPDTLDAIARAMAHAIVRVGLARFGSSFNVTTSVTRNDLGTVIGTFTADAPDSASLPRLLRVLGDSAKFTLLRIAPQLRASGAGRFASPVAIRLLQESFSRNSQRDYFGAVEMARAATRADSNYVDAWQRLALFLDNARMNRAEMLDAEARAFRLRNRTTELSAAEITRDYYTRTEQLNAAVAASESLAALGERRSLPPWAGVENSTGILRTRRGEHALAEESFRRAIDLLGDIQPVFAHTNLVAALLAQGKLRSADSLIRMIEATDRTGVFTRRAREFRAMITRDYDGVVALARADLVSADRPEFAKAFSLFRLAAALLIQGRPQQADSAALAGEELIARLGDPSVALKSALTRAVQTLAITGDSAQARRIVAEAERKYSPAAMRFMDRRHADRIIALAALGDTLGARRVLTEWQRDVPKQFSRVDDGAIKRGRGEIALAEHRLKEALSLFLNPEFGYYEWDLVNVGRAFDALGQADSAIVYFERSVRIPADDGLGLNLEVRPMVLERLGELYEQQGQRAKALESYEAFVALWKNAEPEQQRVVTDVKARIAKLRRVTG